VAAAHDRLSSVDREQLSPDDLLRLGIASYSLRRPRLPLERVRLAGVPKDLMRCVLLWVEPTGLEPPNPLLLKTRIARAERETARR
jgi:hypothetical protein